MVSRMVDLLGVSVGREDALLEAKPDNPRGFWENREITAINDDLLGQLGGRWDDPPALETGWERGESLEPFYRRATDALADLFDGVERACWKDPRASLLMPFWRRVATIAQTVIVVRHPVDVFQSLRARDPIDSEWAAELWMRYVVTALKEAPRPLVLGYRDVLAEPTKAVRLLAEHLARSDERAVAAATASIEPGLDHSEIEEIEQGDLMNLAIDVFDRVKSGRTDRLVAVAGELMASRAALRASLHREDDFRGQRDRGIAQLEKSRQDRASMMAESERQVASLMAESERQTADLEARDQKVELLQAEVEMLKARADRLNRAVARSEDHARHLGMQLRGESYVAPWYELVEGSES